jgi:hypothetical protein
MATNRDMLAEAIADAKAVKDMAIANAKAALEEAFTPQLKSMLSLKLQEMADEDMSEESVEEMYDDVEEGFGEFDTPENTGFGEMGKKALDEEDIDLEELLAEIENEEEIDETLNEAEEAGESEEEEAGEEEEEEGEPMKLEDMTDEDLKAMIADVIADMVEAGELEAGNEEGEGEEGEEEIDMEMDGEEEDVDLAELLREIEGEGSSIESLASTLRREFPNASINVQNIEGTDDEGMEIVINDDTFISAGAYNEWDAMIDGEEESFKSDAELIDYLKGSMLAETTSKLTTELEAAHATINTLRSELNEINLLNAKLLYTNKIFKAKTLNEEQKVKVLSSFDKATTVKEVKLVYSTLNEGLKVKNTPIRENLGRASKATNTPVVNTKQPIVESNAVFDRMRKLAGLI